MENIRDFYKDRDNLKTIPTCILDELRKYSTIYSSHAVRGVDGKFVTTYGKKTLPIFMKYNYKDLNFYLLETHFEDIARFFRVTTVLSEDAVILKYNKLHDYYKSYSDGFEKGYNECESLFQEGNSLFKKTDETIAFNIYSRVVGNENKGGFSFYALFELDEVQRFSWFKNESRFMLSEKRLNSPYFLSLKGCFESGYNGGVFYKCWLLILDNPLLFKTFFLENERTNTLRQPASEAVKPDEVYKNQNLFKVGLLFAKGEMNKYYTINNLNQIVLNNGLSPSKIANEFGNPSFEKWILASKNNYKNSGKNIFNNLDMMTKIISDCKTKKIPVEPYFISRLPIE